MYQLEIEVPKDPDLAHALGRVCGNRALLAECGGRAEVLAPWHVVVTFAERQDLELWRTRAVPPLDRALQECGWKSNRRSAGVILGFPADHPWPGPEGGGVGNVTN